MANPLAAFQQGFGNALEQGQAVQQMGRRNALFDVYEQHGQGIAQGDPQALSALAGVDPMAAYDLRRQQAADRRAQSRYDMEMARIAQSLSAEEAAAERQQLQRAVQIASAAQSPEEWDALAQQYGAEQLVGQFENRDAVIRGLMTFDQFLAERTGPEPMSGAGKFYADQRAGFVPADAQYSGGGVTVNTGDMGPQMGSVPQGYAVVEAPGTEAGYRMVPIPGGPEDTTQEDAARREQTERYADVVLEDIGNVMREVEDGGFPVTGFAGWATSRVPGAPARDVSARLDTIRANIGFDRLQQMRDASPTGGALGQVSENENRLLQSTLGNLEQSQSREQFLDNLRRVERIYLDIIHGPGNWQKAEDGRVVLREQGASRSEPARGADRQQAPQDSDMTFEQFAQDPSAIAAAERYGVTLQEMWDIKQGMR